MKSVSLPPTDFADRNTDIDLNYWGGAIRGVDVDLHLGEKTDFARDAWAAIERHWPGGQRTGSVLLFGTEKIETTIAIEQREDDRIRVELGDQKRR